MHIKLKRSPGIYIAGFMGSGKTTVGRLLAESLGWDFVDLDSRDRDAPKRLPSRGFSSCGASPSFGASRPR